jgi:hypothetical protein
MTEASSSEEPLASAGTEALRHQRIRHKRRLRSAAWMILQVLLIGVGVFLGLAGEQWRQDRQNYQQAAESLNRIRAEIVANRDSVARVQDYHAAKYEELTAYFAADAETRSRTRVRFEGLQAPTFERTAWDLAMLTGSLAYIDPDFAFQLSRVYNYQALTTELGRGVLQAMYRNPPSETDTTFLAVVHLYFGDLTRLEPGLIEAYDSLLTYIDETLSQ